MAEFNARDAAERLSRLESQSPPIVDRATFLPIGQYEDGSLTFAWPGIVKDTYDSIVNSYSDVAQGRRPQTSDVLNVATAPVMGNLAARAVGAMPEGALGVGASKPPVGNIKGARPEPSALSPKAEAMGKSVLADEANLTPFDVAEQVAKLIGSDPAIIRHHPTSFGNSSYIGPYRISDHSVGSGRYATEGPGFDYREGAEAIAARIMQGRREQIDKLLSEPPPTRQSWMNNKQWREELQRYNNRRPGWLTREQWEDIKSGKVAYANAPEGSLLPLGVHALEQAQQKGVLGAALPMDQASRLARAREMGFDTDRVWYHGTDRDFDAFDVGAVRATGEPDHAIALSDSPHLASAYAGARPAKGGSWRKLAEATDVVQAREGGNVIPTYVRMQNPMHVTMPEWGSRAQNARLLAEADALGHDGIIFDYTHKAFGPNGLREALVLDPSNIRSVNAAFDPTQSGSANLLAANAPEASLLPLLFQSYLTTEQ